MNDFTHTPAGFSLDDILMDIKVQRPTDAELAAAARPIREDTNEVRRRARLTLRVIYSQPDIDHVVTNAVADDHAVSVYRSIQHSAVADALQSYAEQLLAEADAAGFDESTTARDVAEKMLAEAKLQRSRG